MESVSPNVSAETNLALKITQLLENPSLSTSPLPTGDGRYSIASLLVGTHPANRGDTLILMGHYDTVGSQEFAPLDPEYGAEIATMPEKLREIFSVDPDTPSHVRSATTETDDVGYVWMFGRGSVDMKSGVAINIGLIHELSKQRDKLAGNILFLACPDEENESKGVRTAVPQLHTFAQENKLTYIGLINTDYSTHINDIDDGKSAYLGSIGKLLPSAYIIGVPTHVGEPYRGIDANIIMAEIIRAFHFNQDLAETAQIKLFEKEPLAEQDFMVSAVPPIVLKATDLKTVYNVQTAHKANLNLNWLTLDQSPAQVLAQLKTTAQTALTQLIDAHKTRANHAGFTPSYGDGTIYLFQQLVSQIEPDLYNDICQHAKTNFTDLRNQSLHIVQSVAQALGISDPSVILYYAPPYYPSVQPETSPFVRTIRDTLQEAPFSETNLQGYFPLISDLSYIAAPDPAHIHAWQANAPLAETADFKGLPNLPVANIGTWGFDAHGLYERVHIPYTFETVPHLIKTIIFRTLTPEKRSKATSEPVEG